MGIWLPLHALIAVFAFGMLMVPGLIFERIAETGDVRTIRSVFAIATKRAQIGGPLVFLAGFIGLWLVHQMGFAWNSGWLIASYACFIGIVVLGIGYHARWENKVYELALASPDDAPSAELRAVIDQPNRRSIGYMSAALWLAILYLMVAKPF